MPMKINCNRSMTWKANNATVRKNDMKMLMPPTLGTAPTCDVRLLGFTTKSRALATRTTMGMNAHPMRNATRADT